MMSDPIPGPPQHPHDPWARPPQGAVPPAHPWPSPPVGWGPPFPGPPAPAPGPVAAPPGSAYHEQGRNGRQGGGARTGEFFLAAALMLAGLLLVFFGAVIVSAVLGLEWAPDGSDSFFADPLFDNAVLLVSLASWIPAVLIAVRVCGKRPVGTLVSVVGRLRWGWLGWCFGLALGVLVLQNLVLSVWSLFQDGSEVVGGEVPGWPELLLSLVVLWALVPFQAAAEEFVFRGWLVQLFGGFLRSPWPGVAVASVLFALAHGFGQLSGFLLLCYSAAWWGWLTIRTGGLEAVIAIHTVNNLIAFSLSAVFGELADDGTAADAPWEALATELVFAPLFCLVVVRLADRRGITSRTPGPTV